MQTLNYALAQVVQQERAQELDVAAHIPRGTGSPRNVRSLRTVLASLRRSSAPEVVTNVQSSTLV
jgi:hypothetical protein